MIPSRFSLFLFIVMFVVSATAQPTRNLPPLPIPLGKTPAPLPPLTNLPPFVSIYDPKPAPPAEARPPATSTIVALEPRKVSVASPAATPEPTTTTTAPVASASNPTPAPAAPKPPALSPEERKARVALLNQILSDAMLEAGKYNKLFRDLSAEETRLSERFNDKGEVEFTRKVSCDLVVYQSRLSETMGYEYRQAKAINGKAQKIDEKNITKFFQKLLKASSVQRELDLINEVGFQYDLPLGASFYGLTLFQWREIEPWAIQDVGFDVLGREFLDGVETVVLYYQQTQTNSRLEWELPGGFGFAKPEQRVRGRLWLDIKNMQIRQGEREMWVKLAANQEPLRIWRQTLSYKPSLYGVWVPRKFVSDFYFRITRNKDGSLTAAQSGRLTSEYGEFKRFDVTSEEQEKKTILKEPAKPNS